MIPCEYDDDDKVEYADDVNGDFVEYDEMAPLLPCVFAFCTWCKHYYRLFL